MIHLWRPLKMCTGLELEITPDTRILWPHIRNTYCRRSIHKQEIFEVLLENGIYATTLELYPTAIPIKGIGSAMDIRSKAFSAQRFVNLLAGRTAVLVTLTHYCAWDGKRVYDPEGIICSLNDYEILEAWVIKSK
jgi:hypothetical protein